MKIAYLTIIKDEQDLIYQNLTYHYNIGIRSFYVMFNNSNNETKAEVIKFTESKKDIYIKVYDDYEIAYRQPDRLKMMSEQAFKDGHTWIIPIDADEILKISKYKTIQEILQRYDHHPYGFIICSWIDYHPTSHDQNKHNSVFKNWKYRDKKRRPISKVIVKWKPGMSWGDGHHFIKTCRVNLGRTKVIIYAHFPNRSKAQLRKKMITIGKAFVATFGEDSTRRQVEQYLDYQERGNIIFDEVWSRITASRKKNEQNYKFDPINPDLFD